MATVADDIVIRRAYGTHRSHQSFREIFHHH